MPDQKRAESPDAGSTRSDHRLTTDSAEAQELEVSPAQLRRLLDEADPALSEDSVLDMRATHGHLLVQRTLHRSPVVERDHHDRAGTTLPAAPSESVTFESSPLSIDRVQVREVLDQRITQHGTETTERFITRFRASAAGESQTECSRHGMAPRYRATTGVRIIGLVDAEWRHIQRDAAELVTRFQTAALHTLGDVLDESARIFRRKQVRYGVAPERPVGVTMQAPLPTDIADVRRSVQQSDHRAPPAPRTTTEISAEQAAQSGTVVEMQQHMSDRTWEQPCKLHSNRFRIPNTPARTSRGSASSSSPVSWFLYC